MDQLLGRQVQIKLGMIYYISLFGRFCAGRGVERRSLEPGKLPVHFRASLNHNSPAFSSKSAQQVHAAPHILIKLLTKCDRCKTFGKFLFFFSKCSEGVKFVFSVPRSPIFPVKDRVEN